MLLTLNRSLLESQLQMRCARHHWTFRRAVRMWPSARNCMPEQRPDPSICRLFGHYMTSWSFDLLGKKKCQHGSYKHLMVLFRLMKKYFGRLLWRLDKRGSLNVRQGDSASGFRKWTLPHYPLFTRAPLIFPEILWGRSPSPFQGLYPAADYFLLPRALQSVSLLPLKLDQNLANYIMASRVWGKNIASCVMLNRVWGKDKYLHCSNINTPKHKYRNLIFF